MCRKEPVMLTVASRKKTISKANTVIIHKILFSQIVYLLTIHRNFIAIQQNDLKYKSVCAFSVRIKEGFLKVKHWKTL